MKFLKQLLFLLILIPITNCSEDTVDFLGIGIITGRVVEADNFNPIENAKIVLTPTNNTVFTDTDGYFIYEEVEIGDYSVSATKDEFLTNFQPATVTRGLEVNVVFELLIETAGNKPPTAPVLIAPEDNSTNIDLAVELVWSTSDPDTDELTYKIRVKNSVNNDILLVEDVLDTTYVVSNLALGAKYFWEVSATDNINEEVWSSTSSFETLETTGNRFLFVKQENGNNVIYSSDESGNKIALTSNTQNSWRPRNNLATNTIAFLKTENFETHLFTMKTDGSNVFKVTTVSLEGFKQSELDFSWSSNGSKLIYPHFDKLYEINKDGSGLRLVYQTQDGSFISECDWSSNGNTIALKTNNSNGYDISIYTIDMNGNIMTTILTGVNGAAGGLNLSVDGKMLLYTYDVSEFESSEYRQLDNKMFIHYFDTDTKVDISEEKISGTNDYDPRFSPNEAEIIFVNTSNDDISPKNIFTQRVNRDSNNATNFFDRSELFNNAIMPDWE
jgi:Carboxypeptidase regulatory-like domain